nr:MAG TPA: hypothetical protein [Caudoviricetes sp.]
MKSLNIAKNVATQLMLNALSITTRPTVGV